MKSVDLKIRVLLAQFLLGLIIMQLCRVAFYGLNQDHFATAGANEFMSGIRFDFSALFWLLLPYLLIALVNLVINLPPLFLKLKNWFFQLGIAIAVLFNCIDIEYYKYTLKRSTFDFFKWFGQGEDIYDLGPKFLVEFWYIDLIFIALIALSIWGYKRIEDFAFKVAPKQRDWIQRTALSLFLAAFFVIGGRGGIQLIPLGIVDVTLFTTQQNAALVLNTPFSILRTIGKKGVPSVSYFKEDELNSRYSPIHSFSDSLDFQAKNVVVIILESFSMEFVGDDEKSKQLTPFLQSLKGKSTFYPNCFANGKKSIEALPAILSGIPTLMDEPYISSAYGANAIESFPSYLEPLGYNTSFFHGGKNGTMNFDGFTASIGIDKYYGKTEYNNDADFDGAWGIYDEPFFQYLNRELTQMKEPFFTSVFSLSSHHPYSIPNEHQNTFTYGSSPLENTIAYTDYSLKKFFESAQKTDWFENTVFIITADHTPNSPNPLFQNRFGMYRIPLFVYDPSNEVAEENKRVCQQIDILPTVLDYLKYKGPIFSFGQSVFSEADGFAIQYFNQSYQLITAPLLYQMTLKQGLGLYNFELDRTLGSNLLQGENAQKLDEQLKAIVQSYNTRVGQNQLTTR